MIPLPRELVRCGLCKRPIFWARTAANNQPMPLDPVPDPELGKQAAYRVNPRRWTCRVLREGEAPGTFEHIFVPHFATCEVLKAQRAAKQPLPAGVLSLDAARAARAASPTRRDR